MAKYHKYVFDPDKRQFVGDFEKMYLRESTDNFDSWHQDDSRQLQRLVAISILAQWNFDLIFDFGCGKGALTHILKKKNNEVIGLDISETAIKVAASRFPDITFESADLNDVSKMITFSSQQIFASYKNKLVFISECLSYLSNWKELISALSVNIKYLMVSLYLPENPIGFVKSFEEIEQVVGCSYKILESVWMKEQNSLVIFAKSNVIKEGI